MDAARRVRTPADRCDAFDLRRTCDRWGFHYVVGIAYAALYLAISRLVLGSGPTLISALVFAIALLVVPWFVMQPALGLGFFAAEGTLHPSVLASSAFPGMQLSASVSISVPSRPVSFEPMRGTGVKLYLRRFPRPTDAPSPTLNLRQLLPCWRV